MFLPDFHSDVPIGNQLLAEIGLDPQTIRETIEDDRAMRCPDRGVSFPERRVRGPLPGHAVTRGSLELEEGLRRVNEGGSGEGSRSPTFITHRHHPVHEGDTPWLSDSTGSS